MSEHLDLLLGIAIGLVLAVPLGIFSYGYRLGSMTAKRMFKERGDE